MGGVQLSDPSSLVFPALPTDEVYGHLMNRTWRRGLRLANKKQIVLKPEPLAWFPDSLTQVFLLRVTDKFRDIPGSEYIKIMDVQVSMMHEVSKFNMTLADPTKQAQIVWVADGSNVVLDIGSINPILIGGLARGLLSEHSFAGEIIIMGGALEKAMRIVITALNLTPYYKNKFHVSTTVTDAIKLARNFSLLVSY